MKKLLNKLSTLLLPIAGGLLGALGGAEDSNKAFRRILIPLSLSGFAYVNLENFFVFTIMIMAAPISMGYGIPSSPNQTESKIGTFYYNLFHQNHLLADIFTRGTIGLLIAISLISIPIIKHNWLIYLWCSLAIVMVNAFLSWRNFGQYTLFNRKLNWSETLTWGLITLFATLSIILGGR
jgi:hypothetical protein